MKGWLSHVVTSLSFKDWSVTSSIEYKVKFPAVGARNVALSISALTSALTSRFSYSRTDLRFRSISMV